MNKHIREVNMNDKGPLSWFASKELMHRKNKNAFNEKQVVRKMIVNVLYVINEVGFSIYTFLTLNAKSGRN